MLIQAGGKRDRCVRACFAQHMDVDPGRYKVGEAPGHDDDALALKEAAVVGRCVLLKSGQLCLSALDTSSVSKQEGCSHTSAPCVVECWASLEFSLDNQQINMYQCRTCT